MCILTYWGFSFFIFSSLLGHPPHNIDPKASFSEFSLWILHAKPFQDLKFYFHFGSKFSLESRAKLLSFNTMGNQANLRNKLKKESNIKKSFLARSKKNAHKFVFLKHCGVGILMDLPTCRFVIIDLSEINFCHIFQSELWPEQELVLKLGGSLSSINQDPRFTSAPPPFISWNHFCHICSIAWHFSAEMPENRASKNKVVTQNANFSNLRKGCRTGELMIRN